MNCNYKCSMLSMLLLSIHAWSAKIPFKFHRLRTSPETPQEC